MKEFLPEFSKQFMPLHLPETKEPKSITSSPLTPQSVSEFQAWITAFAFSVIDPKETELFSKLISDFDPTVFSPMCPNLSHLKPYLRRSLVGWAQGKTWTGQRKLDFSKLS